MAELRSDEPRRNGPDRRNRSDRRRSSETRLAAVEICDRNLYVALVARGERGEPRSVFTRMLKWRKTASTIHSKTGRQELQDAFAQLVREEHLTGATMRIALGGRHCVTRVLAGTIDHVRRELTQLEERSQMYLSLGPGHKALAGSVTAMDARHQHALLAVTNQKTLDAVVRIAHDLGVHLEFIEPSLVSLSRVLPGVRGMAKDPTIVIHFDKEMAELGICRDGRLLLDYRPNSIGSAESLADLVVLNLSRLQRFCDRNYAFARQPLRRVVICGHSENAVRALRAFEQKTELVASLLEPELIDAPWEFTGGNPGTDSMAVLGAALAAQNEQEVDTPNLLEDVIAHTQQPAGNFLLKALLPFAATLLVAAAGVVMNRVATRQNDALQAEIQLLAPVRAQARKLMLVSEQTTRLLAGYRELEARLPRRNWDGFLAVVAKCLPEDVWLERLAVKDGNLVSLSGAGFGDTGVYEFVHWLEKVPGFESVTLRATNAIRSTAGPATGFDLAMTLANLGGQASKEALGD